MLKKILISSIIVAIIVVLIFYIIFLAVLPRFLSSSLFINNLNKFTSKNFDFTITTENINAKTYPQLIIDISVDKLNINSNKGETKLSNVSLNFDLKSIQSKKIPIVNIDNAKIELEQAYINLDNLMITQCDGLIKFVVNGEINSELFKNSITIGENGYFYLRKGILYAENFEIKDENSKLIINGKIIDKNKKSNFTIIGNDIPISSVMSSLLYFQKSKDKSKKFIENFYEYSGKLNVDLKITENGIFGAANVENLMGKSVLFDVPIHFDKVPVTFKGREVFGGAFGDLGGEKVYADFKVENMALSNQIAYGFVNADLTNKSVGKYIPNASIINKVIASVKWNIQNKNINVNYKINIPQNSDIHYLDAYLGLIDEKRQIFIKTLKNQDKLKITNYDYSIMKSNKKTKILLGEGLFLKKAGKFQPEYITCKTENDAPVTVAASFYKYLEGGVFNGNLKYDFNKNKIIGTFNIKNSKYKHYRIDEAKVLALNSTVKIQAQGKFRNSPFNAQISGLNDFNKKIEIYNLYLFLDELVINKNKRMHSKIKIDEKEIKSKTDNFDIDVYTIKLNKIKYNRAVLENILLKGSIKDNIFNFEIFGVNFAKGILNAKGLYDFKKRSSDVIITANNINSNIAADTLFNLQNQIEGNANALFKIETKNGILDRKGYLNFSIKDGYLPQLGSTEFIIKKSKRIRKSFKFKLEDIINIDIKNMEALSSDIDGCFRIDNGQIDDLNITSSQKYLSLLVVGNYNIDSQETNLQLFGKYNNKEISKIKIFHLPLSFIVKIIFHPEKTMEKYKEILKKVPEVKAENKKDESAFRVKMNGNINKNDVKVEMKSII